MPAAENIVIRYNAFTAGYSFHKVKTAFKAFSFVLKIVFSAVLLMQNQFSLFSVDVPAASVSSEVFTQVCVPQTCSWQ